MLRALRGAVGGWGARGLLSQVLVMLLYRRLGGILGQMERLCLRFQAGRLWLRGPRGADVAQGAAAVGVRARVGVAWGWPGRFGWLVRAASWQAACYGSQLRVVLERPEMVELLMAAPQAARILRPVCQMLMIEGSVLRPGVAVVAAAPRVAVVRVRRPRVVMDFGRIPLPRGVLSWARRWGYGRVRDFYGA